MAARFDISVLLKVFSEGLDSFQDLADSFDRISEKGKQTQRVLRGLKVSERAAKDIRLIEEEIEKLNRSLGQTKEIGFNPERANVFSARLKLIIKDLEGVQKAARNADDATRFTKAAVAAGNARQLLTELEKVQKSANSVNNEFKQFVIKAQLSNQLRTLKTEVTGLEKELQKAVQTGNQLKVNDLTPKLNDASKKVNDLTNDLKKLGDASKIQASLGEVERIAGLQRQVQALTPELLAANKAKNDLLTITAPATVAGGLGAELAKVKSEARGLQSELDKAIKAGDIGKISELIGQLNALEQRLNGLQREFTELGQKSKVELIVKERTNLDELRNRIQALTNAELEVNRNKIEIQARALNEFADVRKQLAQLQNEINTFVKKNGTLTVQAKLEFQERGNQLQARVNKLAGSLPEQQQQQFLRTNLAVQDLRKNLASLQTAAPESFFKRLTIGFGNVFNSAGGVAGALRGLAGAFRLAGTTAFVGQLRTLGFALTAVASIIQNVLPILTGLIEGLVALGPPGIAAGIILGGLATSFTLVASKIGLTFGLIASVIPTGIQFNKLLEETANGAAAVAQQFQVFSVNGKSLEEFFGGGVTAAQKFGVAVEAVRDQLPRLEQGALGTLFTTEQLVSSLEQTIIALGGLAPSLESATDLTIKFAGVAGILGLSQDKLASSIQQVVAGTGRITNRLQQLLNQTKDSEGIELTAKRIKELRAAGGTKLFDELSFALNQYSEAVIQANRQSFSGVLSNFQDLFQAVSRRSTANGFEVVKKGLAGIFEQLVKFKTDANGNVIIELSNDLQRIIAILDQIIERIAKDLVAAAQKLAGLVDDVATFLEENYEVILDTYQLIILIAEEIGKLLGDLANIFLLSSKTSTQFKVFNTILATIVITIGVFRTILANTLLVVGSLIAAFSTLGRIIFTIIRTQLNIADFLIPDFGVIDGLLAKLDGAVEFLGKSAKFGTDLVKDGIDVYKDSINDATKAVRILNEENGKFFRPKKDKNKITSAGTGQGDPDKDKKARNDRLKSLLELEQRLAEARRKLAAQVDQNELKLIQERLKQQQALIQAGLDQNLISQQEASQQSLKITQKGIDAEVQSRRNALELLNQERLEKEKNFTNELRLIQAKGNKDPKKGGLTVAEESNKVQELNLKREIERTDLLTRELQITGEIDQLELSRNESLQQYLVDLSARTKASQKELDTIRQTVAELSDQNSEQTLNLKILGVVKERLDEIQALENEITGIRRVRNNTTDSAQRKVLTEQLGIAQEKLNLLQKEIVLRQQNLRFEAAENIGDRAKFDSAKVQDTLQRQVNQGLIDQRQYIIESTAEQIRLKNALLKVLDAEEKVLAANPGNEDQRRKVADLRQEIDNLKTTIADERLLQATNDIRDSFTDLFTNLQDSTKLASDSIRDFANSVLQTFRRLLAEKIVRDLFSNLFPKEGQTEGQAGGVIAGVLRAIGLGVDKEQKAAEQRAQEKGSALDKQQEAILDTIKRTSENREAIFGKSLDNLTNELNNGTILIKQALNSLAASINSTLNDLSGIDNLGDVLPDNVNIDDIGSKFASGGMVPAKVSNGEYRMGSGAVKRYGTGFMSKLNNFASGGNVLDSLKYDFSGGGAKLRNLPAPIRDTTKIPTLKKKGKKKSIFGNILSFAAPFLGLIPGIGPFLQLGAGALGGALTGEGAKGSILGGIFGGLGNLGGFSNAGGSLGKISSFFSGQGGILLSLLGGSNLGGLGGSSLLKLLKKFGLGRGKIVDSIIPGSGSGGVFAKSGGLIQSFAGGGLADLLPIFSLFGGLFNRSGSSSSQQLPEIEDPDLANINKYGSALKPLREMGAIPDFIYNQATVDYLDKQESGKLNSSNKASSSFGSSLNSLLPFLLLALQGGTNKASGGLIKGRGTGTSDSIFAMLSSGEYIIKAAAVKALGTNLLDSINAGRFASGGLVGANTVSTIPQNRFNPTINVQAPNYSVINNLDPNLLQDYLNTSQGKGALLNVISRNPKGFNEALGKR